MSEFTFVNQLQEQLAPLKVTVDLQTRNQIYVLTIDGTATYKDLSLWDNRWGGFENFGNGYTRAHTRSKPNLLSPTRIEYELGTLLDILKQV